MVWKDNLNLLTDFYELTMSNGFVAEGMKDIEGNFDMFFRRVPENGGFAIFAGLEQLIEYIQNFKFTESDIEFLRSKAMFSEEFIKYLKDFRFECDIWAVPEGTPVFPYEPLIKVRGPIVQAQLIETMLLLLINHQTLIATKANRVVRAANGNAVMEFGSRRAQGTDGAFYGARAAYIGGCVGTACTLDEKELGIPAIGTMAHSWIQMFDSELEAFKAYARQYPDSCTLLVDTYSVLNSGIPNAIKAFDEVLKPMGKRPKGVRIDSGDIAYLSIEARKLLDAAGYEDCGIVASNSLDEYLIRDLTLQGAKINSYGVGEALITSRNCPVFGGVYKLSGVKKTDEWEPKIKLSENVAKITNPGLKELYRLYDCNTGKALGDVITVEGEQIDESKPYVLFDEKFTWKKKEITNYTARKLLTRIFDKGELVYEKPTINEIRAYCKEEIGKLWDTILRFENPHTYYVDLSQKLWDLKKKLIEENR